MGRAMVPDPVWLAKFVTKAGAIGPWMADTEHRWTRRWVSQPQLSPPRIEGESEDIAAVVTFEDGAWGWATPWDCDAGSEDVESCKLWCDNKLPVALARMLHPDRNQKR